MSDLMMSVDDHIDLPYLPSDLWTVRLPDALRARGPDRDGHLLDAYAFSAAVPPR